MAKSSIHNLSRSHRESGIRRHAAARSAFPYSTACLLLVIAVSGCSAFHPVRGVPAAYLPDEIHGPTRGDMRTIDLGLLVRTPPDQHRVEAGDVLSIYIPGVLGRGSVDFNSEVGVEPPINNPSTPDDKPTIGFPITVRDDHTISLPQIPPLNVYNMTLHDVEQALRRAYTIDRMIVKSEEEMILVSLVRPRDHRVLVVRQEASSGLAASTSGVGTVNVGSSRRGTARVVRLKAYENDVLHALSEVAGVDGLPGLDAENTVYIIRRRQRPHMVPQPMFYGQPIPAQQPTPAWQPTTAQPAAWGVRPVAHTQSTQSPGVAQALHSTTASQPYNQQAISLTGHSLTHQTQGTMQGGHAMQFQQQQVMRPVQYVPPTSALMPTPIPQPVATYPQQSMPSPDYSHYGAADYSSAWSSTLDSFEPTINNPNVVKIPIRLQPGEVPQFTEEDITLCDGDIVFIESRETEVFYTGGLLGGGQYTLPRDYDLRVLEAISIAEGRQSNGGQALRSVGGVSALNRDVATSASRVAILRNLPNGQRVTIEVDLNKAMRYKEENILVQPGDMLLLQYTFPEATAAFVQRFLLEGALIGIATSTFTGGGGGT